MTERADGGRRGGRIGRMAPWILATLVLLLPLAAMQVTGEVAWGAADFAFMAVLLYGACGVWRLTASRTASFAYRAGVGVAVLAALVLVWMTFAVGLIGSEDHPANLLYGGVLAVGVLGAVLARFRSRGLARALAATALAQTLVGAAAVLAGWGADGANGPAAVAALTGIFAALWLAAAWLFQRAAWEQAAPGYSFR